MASWWVETKGDYAVRVMNAAYLVNYLASEKQRFTQEELRPIVGTLDELCRTLEF